MLQVHLRHSVRIRRNHDVWILHARRKYYGNPRYDFALIHGGPADEDPWLARIIGIFDVHVQPHDAVPDPGWLPFVLIQWLERVNDEVAGIPTYQYCVSPELRHPLAVSLGTVERPVRLVAAHKGLDEVPRFCALPYGKMASLNEL